MNSALNKPTGSRFPMQDKTDGVGQPSGSAVLSPCINICKLDSDFVCIGCSRTIDEVLKWPEYTDEQKQEVLDRIFN